MSPYLARLRRLRALLISAGTICAALVYFLNGVTGSLDLLKSFICRFSNCEVIVGRVGNKENENANSPAETKLSSRIKVQTEVIYGGTKIITHGGSQLCSEYAGFYVVRGKDFVGVGNNDTILIGDELNIYITSRSIIVSPKFVLTASGGDWENLATSENFERIPKSLIPSAINDGCPAENNEGKNIYVKRAHIPIIKDFGGREITASYDAEDLYQIYPINIRVDK